MKKQQGNAIVGLLFAVIWVGAIVGWVLNIMVVAETTNASITGMFILRCIGIFVAPLGAVLGYF